MHASLHSSGRTSGKRAGWLAPVLAAALCLGSATAATAQVSSYYSFAQSAGTYAPLTGGTLVVANTDPSPTGNDSAAIDDFSYAPVSLPFAFNIAGNLYTSFQINSNGWIYFGTFNGTNSAPISSTSAYSAAIAGFGANLMGPQQSTGNMTSGSATITNIGNTTFCTVGAAITGTGIPAGTTVTAFTANTITISAAATSTGTGRTVTWTAGEIRAGIQGTAPNRVCVVQFRNMSRYTTAGSGINFQIRLNEGGGVAANQTIQIVYGDCFSATATTAQVGLRGMTNADYNNRTGTTSWAASTAGTANSNTMTYSATVLPAAGQTYTWNPPPNCSGKPVAGTITPVTPCSNQNFQLAVTPVANVLGLSYQWQDSTPAGWQNSIGASAATPVYNGNIAVPTRFRLIVSCGPSGQSDTTAPYEVSLAPFIGCYCTPTYATGSTTNTVRSVRLKNMTNSSTGASPWYADYTAQQPATIAIPSLTMGVTDTLQATFGTNATNYSAVWIDFNHNGFFDIDEYFTEGTNAGAGGTARIRITPPLTAEPGLTRMRIRGADRAILAPPRACGPTGSAYGEAEDYLVNIEFAPCSGAANAGAAVASEKNTCRGYTVNVWDSTHEHRRSQLAWSWELSYDGGQSWSAVPNSAGKDTLNNVPVAGNMDFRLKMACLVSGDTTYSSAAVVRIKPPHMCYCYSQSDGGKDDVSDIGAVVIGTMVNSTGGPHVQNPAAIRRRTDYTDIPSIVMRAGGSYQLSIYHTQRNELHRNARISVFLDFNNDLKYDAAALPVSERVYSAMTTQGNFYLDTVIKIPNSVIPDVPTGMRVILNDDVNPNSPANLGCGPYVSGETEDYVVTFRRVPQGVDGMSRIAMCSLYPNPSADGRFTVRASGDRALGDVTLTVTGLTGQVMLQQSHTAAGTAFTQELDLSAAAKGIYFITLRTADGEKAVRKLVIH